MDYPTRLDFCDGKYTVIYDFRTGQSECLRYGQPWRQLVGDKMVLAMFDRVVELQAEVAVLKAELQAASARLVEQEHASHSAYGNVIDEIKAELEQWQRSVCDQGEVIENLKAELAAVTQQAETRKLALDAAVSSSCVLEAERDRLAELCRDAACQAEAVPQCTHKYEIDSDHPNHSCCQNCGEILKDGVHVQPVAQARSRAGMLAAAEMERSKGK